MNEEFDDVFARINQFPKDFYDQGFNQAIKELTPQIPSKSFSKGYEKGKELALEIGYYSAIVDNLKFLYPFLMEKFGNRKEKIEKNLLELEKYLINFDINEENEEENLKNLLLIRAKLKILCSLSEIKLKINEENI